MPLYHSWPLFERDRRFDLGHVLGEAASELPPIAASSLDKDAFAGRAIGLWECDLSDEALTWSGAVYDIFGLPRASRVRREDSVALYCGDSRAAMERLRAHAIKHRRGFTLDVEIRPALVRRQWIRLIAAPICEHGRVVRLHGLKMII